MLRRFSFAVIFLVSFATVACQGKPGQTPPGQAGKPQATKIPISEHTSVDPAAMAGLSWWHNEELGGELKLDSGQQKKMDRHLEELLAQWRPNVKMRRGAQARFIKALKAGEFDQARKIAEDYGKAQAFFESGALILKTQVLRELRPEQLQLLWERHPKVIKGRWITSGRLKASPQKK